MGEAGISDNDRCELYPQQATVLIAGIAAVQWWVFFGGLSERLVTSLLITTEPGSVSADPGEVKLLSRSDLFLCGLFELYW